MLDAFALLLRTTAGLIVAGFGVQKILRWFPTEIRDEHVGSLVSRASFRSVMGATQILAGILLALGVWPFGSSLILAGSIAALASSNWNLALWGQANRIVPLTLAAIAGSMIVVGPGRYSVGSVYLEDTAARVTNGGPGGTTEQGNATSEQAGAQFCSRASLRAIARRPGGASLCSHGADPGGDVGALVSGRDVGDVPPAPCPAGGRSGPRVQVLYGVPQGSTSAYSTSVGTVRSKVAYANHYLNASGGGAQHIRWLCNLRGKVLVKGVRVISIGDSFTIDRNGNCVLNQGTDTSFTFRDMVCSLTNQTQLGLGTVNYDRPDRVYVVFMDKVADAYGKSYCGQGTLQDDDSPGADNANNTGPSYSLIACWDGAVLLHEIGHNLGAVQLSAGASSGGFHCYDENDVMCYPDGGSYFLEGGSLLGACSTRPWWYFDCARNDYYAVNPKATSYLGTHWNVARSRFLTPP